MNFCLVRQLFSLFSKKHQGVKHEPGVREKFKKQMKLTKNRICPFLFGLLTGLK